jgi:hypothetical protein
MNAPRGTAGAFLRARTRRTAGMGAVIAVVLAGLLGGCSPKESAQGVGTTNSSADIYPVPSRTAGTRGSAAADQTREPRSTVSRTPTIPKARPSAMPTCTSGKADIDCEITVRFTNATDYAKGRPGTVGIVVHDTLTGRTWRNGDAAYLVWTASTIKLAIAVDLLERNRSGDIELGDYDYEEMEYMLRDSDNDATDYLWYEYNVWPLNDNLADYGMADAVVEDGYEYDWGWERATPDDMVNLMEYALTKLDPRDTAYLVNELSNVSDNQHWGVWAAGESGEPGNKNGWSDEDDGYVVNSVGFVGPDQRFTVAIMNAMDYDGTYEDGVETVDEIGTILLGGLFG